MPKPSDTDIIPLIKNTKLFRDSNGKLYTVNSVAYAYDREAYIKRNNLKNKLAYRRNVSTMVFADEKQVKEAECVFIGKAVKKKDEVILKRLKALGKAIKKNEFAYLIPAEPVKPGQMPDLTDKPDAYERIKELLAMTESSRCFNYIPGTELDGGEFFAERLNGLKEAVQTLKEDEPLAVTAKEVSDFVLCRSMPGVSSRWLNTNPALTYFDVVYDIIEQNSGLYKDINSGKFDLHFSFIPTEEDIENRRKYFEANKDCGSVEGVFTRELLKTFEMLVKQL